MKRIAIYGKGGIGKSTIASNLSAAMAGQGVQVLQIGCDPKHDSTRLLMHGRPITTVLDYLRETKPETRDLSDIVYVGYQGVFCVEAGGPEPGVGCAGRGILSTFELLEQLGIEDLGYDVALYDVLGDVVCGGFAVPLRQKYANAIYVVTSGEFMSIYAANNILRGVKNYDGERPRLGGILLNQRGREVGDEVGRVTRFAKAVGLPIMATFPRSECFIQAEQASQTLVEAFPESELAKSFVALSQVLLHTATRHRACPLTDQELEQVVLDTRGDTDTRRNAEDHAAPQVPRIAKVWAGARAGNNARSRFAPGPSTSLRTGHSASPSGELVEPTSPSTSSGWHGELVESSGPRFLSKSVRHREPLGGCAFSGALHTTAQMLDAVTIAHGPRSCSHISQQALVSTARRTRQKYGVTVSGQFAPPLASSEMDESVIVFGGTDELEARIREVARRQPPVIFVVTTCPAGIIGDDVQGVIARLADVRAKTRILPVMVDGNITGDYTQGIINACLDGATSLIDPKVTPEDGLVNIVGEKNLANNAEPNYLAMARLIQALGLRVNCRFVRQTSTADLRRFLRGRLNLLAYDETMGRVLRDFLAERFGAVFARHPFPVGFYETVRWLQEVAAFFGREDRVASIVARQRAEYRALVDRIRPALAGRRMFILTHNHRLDWVLEVAADMDVEIVKLAVLEDAQDDRFLSRYDVPTETGYTLDQINDDLLDLEPDIALSNFVLKDLPEGMRSDRIPICPDVGFQAGLVLADRWHRLLKAPVMEGWRRDATLFAD
jgi:nitrogenase iron protein NifH